MKNWQLLFLFIFPLISSCQEVLDEDVIEMEPKVVIECHIKNEYDYMTPVKVSTTSDYYKTPTSTDINDANVYLYYTSSPLWEDTLYWLGKGTYQDTTPTIYGIPLRTYTVKVELKGKTYFSTSTMPRVTKIDSLGFTYYPDKVFNHEVGYYPIVYFTDNPNEDNYYRISFANGKFIGNNTILIISDKQVIGNAKGFEAPFVYQKNDRAYVELYSITKATYDFYFALNQQLTNDGGFFSSPPANVPGNFNNGALGLFETSSMDTLSIRF